MRTFGEKWCSDCKHLEKGQCEVMHAAPPRAWHGRAEDCRAWKVGGACRPLVGKSEQLMLGV